MRCAVCGDAEVASAEGVERVLLETLCTDHGHVAREGGRNCGTCRRRVAAIVAALAREGFEVHQVRRTLGDVAREEPEGWEASVLRAQG